ncbi:hypothetical protein [Helicobacter cetorum]|uniref:LPS export ABC transporter periplasmic protein LptC n=1 Tax=Helicobacter cetorum (strain ATCC BAA-540 / CCUG 52418 / MIT 99-5656) TaxID=1163745 RepID=I0ES43_HELCM|nr:hypothetical protein [Helicobacter cetorum]AFI05762.1 hypothetical protein HCD_03730 [Helicobacter cetorum MIT 99-5656]
MKLLGFTSNSVLNFFIILSVITIGLVFFFLHSQPTDIVSKENIPKIELENFKAFQMSEQIIDLSIEGKKALQYDDYEIFFDSKISRYDENTIESVKSPKAKRQQDLYFFPKGVTYTRSDNSSFWSETGIYNHKEQSFRGQGNFILTSNEGEVKGFDIFYSHALEIIEAKSIQAYLRIDEIKESQQKNKKRPTLKERI